MVAVFGSGIRVMSDSWITFQPAIDEPSNISPSAKTSSSTKVVSNVTCCHLPRGSVKRRSMYFTSCSLISFSTSRAVVITEILLVQEAARHGQGKGRRGAGQTKGRRLTRRRSNRVEAAFAGADANRLFDGRNENLSVADTAGLRGLADRFNRTIDHFVGEDDFYLHLGKEVDNIFGAPVEFRVALLPAEALCLRDGDPLQPNLL